MRVNLGVNTRSSLLEADDVFYNIYIYIYIYIYIICIYINTYMYICYMYVCISSRILGRTMLMDFVFGISSRTLGRTMCV